MEEAAGPKAIAANYRQLRHEVLAALGKLCQHPRMSRTDTVRSGGVDLPAQVFDPPSAPNGGVIIIAHGSDGMNQPWDDMINGYADSLAQKGFIAIIPNYSAVTDTDPGPGVFTLIEKHGPAWQQAISDTIDYAKTLAVVDATRTGLLGFSLGGYLCLRLRAKAKVLVEFFAPYFEGIGSPGTLTHAEIHHGEDDRLPATKFLFGEKIRDILLKETATQLFGYEHAGHGFITESSPADTAKAKALMAVLGGTDSGNAKAQKDARDRTLTFFATHLST